MIPGWSSWPVLVAMLAFSLLSSTSPARGSLWAWHGASTPSSPEHSLTIRLHVLQTTQLHRKQRSSFRIEALDCGNDRDHRGRQPMAASLRVGSPRDSNLKFFPDFRSPTCEYRQIVTQKSEFLLPSYESFELGAEFGLNRVKKINCLALPLGGPEPRAKKFFLGK